jgi:ABC-type multidrug transport system ATPase subunit
MHFLVADSVGKSFGKRRILSAASLRAMPGEVKAVFGRNGVGKSTLIKIAAGIIQADTGSVSVNGQYLSRPSLPAMARAGLFYLPDHDLLSRSFTLGEQLNFFAQRFNRRTAAEAARLAQVQHLLAHRPHQLSGGELRRAELAAALTGRPACLIADEPYRGISPVDHDSLTEIFRGLAADGCAVVVTGHEVSALLELAHRITWCTSGTTYELGPPAIARANEAFRRDYLVAHKMG